MRRLVAIGICWLLAFTSAAQFCAAAEMPPARPQPVRVYSHLLVPAEHPDYHRRSVKPPGWELFDNQTQFITLRGFSMRDGEIIDFAKALDDYSVKHDLGRVAWPSYPILFAKNLDALAAEIQRRKLYLFDIWGYVPGSGPGGYWQQFKPPASALAMLQSKLGDRWLGTDIGEQDGRYVGGYASQMTPPSAGRFDQYLNFQRHFQRLSDDLGNRHCVLVSLQFGHYLLKEGTATLLGAETAQGLPNAQVFYSFIRGAGKQYGVPWFGNVSIYNRWGFKSYSKGRERDGTSLSLMKRLMYSQILYNCMAVGFENGWFDADGRLSPIGRIQQSAQRWVRTIGQPGVQHTPVAVLLDFDAGWTVPRHLYSDAIYRVWGNLPYEDRDYLTDDVLDLIYPGYADSSYFHDESGFSTATPYGDIADGLLSDAPLWLLNRYGVVVVTGKSRSPELRAKLSAFVAGGGHLVLVGEKWVDPSGKGQITVLPGNGLADRTAATVPDQVDRHLDSPRPLSPAARAMLDQIFRQQRLFEVDPRLGLITCRKKAGEYTLGVLNNSWCERPLEIKSLCGPIESIQEVPLDTAERSAAGFVPPGQESAPLGKNTANTIAGGDIRIFAVRAGESGVAEVPHATPAPPPQGVIFALHDARSIKEEILRRPTFFQHFDGVMVDWRYLHDREKRALARDAAWIKRQGLTLVVDLRPGLNLFPDLRLLDNVHDEYETSMAAIDDVLKKMQVLGARHLLLTLHRLPENNYSDGWQGFAPALKRIAAEAARRGVTLYLYPQTAKSPGSLRPLLQRVGAANLKIAASRATVDAAKKSSVGMWLASSPAELDGRQDHADALVVLDAPYDNGDEERK
jgi:hypothetical protein